MAGISGGVSPALGGLLSTWIVGPLWGINTIIGLSAIVELRRPYITRRRSRILLSMVLLLLASSSGHALVSFADLLNGFLHTDDPSAYFENLPRSLFIARTSFYLALTVEFFMTWRVHVTWGGNNLIILPFIVLNLAGLGLGIVSITRLKVSESRTSLVTSALRVTTATFAMFLAIQVGGTFLIAWRKLATPIVVSEKMTKKWSPRYLFWLFVESGCLYIIATTLSLAWSFGSPAIGNIFTTMLGQVAVFVPLTITLRECWKTKQAYRARPSVTSRLRAETFLVEDRPTVHNRLGPMAVEIEELHDSGNLFGVRIDTTTQEYPDGLKDVKITDGR